jgi:Aspartyl protease
MLIAGEWRKCDDGVSRPMVQSRVGGAAGTAVVEYFLLDTGADSSVLSGGLFSRLGLPSIAPPHGLAFQGIGGTADFVLADAVLEFASEDGATARIRGQIAAFTDPTATDLSILGRDVLNHFDIILSRRNDEVLLLTPNHKYRIESIMT